MEQKFKIGQVVVDKRMGLSFVVEQIRIYYDVGILSIRKVIQYSSGSSIYWHDEKDLVSLGETEIKFCGLPSYYECLLAMSKYIACMNAVLSSDVRKSAEPNKVESDIKRIASALEEILDYIKSNKSEKETDETEG